MWKKYLKQLSLPESFISITLGFLVVIVAGLLLFNYLNRGKSGNNETVKENQNQQEEIAVLPTKHVIADGETLWSIAEKYYHSGYNWVTLAKENNLTNADNIFTGQELNIPKAETIRPESENVSSSQTQVIKNYTVISGDNLWNIAVKEYNDGYAWTKIAKANNLTNPNLIHSGNVLIIP
jgi:nucleoid-associated protein YgaU